MESSQTAESARVNVMSRNGRSIKGLGQEAKKAKAIKVEVKAMDSPEAVDAAEMAGKAGKPASTSG